MSAEEPRAIVRPFIEEFMNEGNPDVLDEDYAADYVCLGTSALNRIMEYAVLTTPGLVIDEQVVFSGRIPSTAEVTTWVTGALAPSEE